MWLIIAATNENDGDAHWVKNHKSRFHLPLPGSAQNLYD